MNAYAGDTKRNILGVAVFSEGLGIIIKLKRATNSTLSMVGLRYRSIEDRHNGIADEFVDRTGMFQDNLARAIEIFV